MPKYIEQVAKENGAKLSVKKSVRFETGEGLEKKVDDFSAAEVAAQGLVCNPYLFIPASNEPSSHACMDIWQTAARGAMLPVAYVLHRPKRSVDQRPRCSAALLSLVPRCLQRVFDSGSEKCAESMN